MTTNIIRPRSKERGLRGVMMERATGLEPADTSLGSWGLTTWMKQPPLALMGRPIEANFASTISFCAANSSPSFT